MALALTVTLGLDCHAVRAGSPAAKDIAKDAPAYAASLQESYFASGKFAESAEIGSRIVQLRPYEAKARYYLAQALVKLNRVDDAKTQFAQCYHATKDATMKLYCQKALANLAAAQNAASNASNSNASNMSSEPSEQDGQKTTDPSLMSRKMQILKAGADEIAYRKKIFDAEVMAAKKHQAEQMEGIPEVLERRFSSSLGQAITSSYENPDYKPAFERSQRELREKVEKLTEEFNRRESDITADCKRRAAAYDDVDKGLASQKNGQNSQIQLHAQHSNSYVRHFVNFNGSTPVGLKTRQQALPLKSTAGAPGK